MVQWLKPRIWAEFDQLYRTFFSHEMEVYTTDNHGLGVQGDKNQQTNTEDKYMFPSHGHRKNSFLETRERCGRWLHDQNQTGCVIVLVFRQDKGWIDGPWNERGLRSADRNWVGNFV